MVFAELPLSINTWCMLNSSILSIITSGLSWGCLTPWASFSEKTMFGSLYLDIFQGGNRECTLFASRACAFFSDLEDPPTTNPPKIIIISPMGALLPPISGSFSFSSLYCLLYDSILRTNFCNFPWRIKVSTWSFRCLHLSMRCPWSWWNLPYLLLSLTSVGAWIGLAHCDWFLHLFFFQSSLL